MAVSGEQEVHENEVVEVQMNDDNVEVIVIQMDDTQVKMVPGDIEIVDLLPAGAQAVFEFRDIFDVLLPGVVEEANKYVTSN